MCAPLPCGGVAGVLWFVIASASIVASATWEGAGSETGEAEESVAGGSGSDTITVCLDFDSSAGGGGGVGVDSTAE